MPPRASKPTPGEVLVTRQVHFNAAHRLYNPAKSKVWNTKMFGLCANESGHGHNYVLEVTVRGRPDPATGFLINLAEIKRIAHEAVVDRCDHRNLNLDVPFLKGLIPTTENLVVAFWNEIAPLIPRPAVLHSVRLYETPRNFAEYRGPAATDGSLS